MCGSKRNGYPLLGRVVNVEIFGHLCTMAQGSEEYTRRKTHTRLADKYVIDGCYAIEKKLWPLAVLSADGSESGRMLAQPRDTSNSKEVIRLGKMWYVEVLSALSTAHPGRARPRSKARPAQPSRVIGVEAEPSADLPHNPSFWHMAGLLSSKCQVPLPLQTVCDSASIPLLIAALPFLVQSLIFGNERIRANRGAAAIKL